MLHNKYISKGRVISDQSKKWANRIVKPILKVVEMCKFADFVNARFCYINRGKGYFFSDNSYVINRPDATDNGREYWQF